MGVFAEMLFIEALHSNHKQFGYNGTDGGEGALGLKLSTVTKQKLSVIAKTRPRRKYTAEHRRVLREKMLGNQLGKGYKRSQDFKDNVARIQLGKKMSPEGVLKRQQARYGPNYMSRGQEGVVGKKKGPEEGGMIDPKESLEEANIVEVDFQLDDRQRQILVAETQQEGFDILQRLMVAEIKAFNYALANTPVSKPAEVLANHALAKAAAQFYQGFMERLQDQLNLHTQLATRLGTPENPEPSNVMPDFQ